MTAENEMASPGQRREAARHEGDCARLARGAQVSSYSKENWNNPTNKEMSKGERDEFHRLNRNTEKTLKPAAVERSARLRAEVEEQLSAIYPQNDLRWVELTEAARN